MKVSSWFATPIWYDVLDLDNTHLEKFCYNMREKDSEGAHKSNLGGWQSKDFADYSKIRNFEYKIKECFYSCFEQMGYHKPNDIIMNCWININKKGDRNKPHVHSHSVYSGVYYVKTNDKSGNIIFERNQLDAFLIGAVPVKTPTELNSCKVCHKPVNGKVVIFPSQISHYVEPNESDEDRISIAFNCSIYGWKP
jgi:uncharacterized protein (TIGR02466 family)